MKYEAYYLDKDDSYKSYICHTSNLDKFIAKFKDRYPEVVLIGIDEIRREKRTKVC